jgi:hypothetical protein
MSNRRYSDDEVREIFARATEAQVGAGGRSSLPATRDGLTLQQLQEIGAEAGIGAAEIAAAARRIALRSQPDAPTVMGIVNGAAYTVRLARRLSDDEWEQFVVRLRETFRARGKSQAEGSLRSWQNGNLQVLLEPDGSGHRVRFLTERRDAGVRIRFGFWTLTFAVPMTAIAFSGGTGDGMAALQFYGPLVAAAMFISATGLVGIKRWSRERQAQFEALGDELLSLPDAV